MATKFQPIHCTIKSNNLKLGKDFAIISMEWVDYDGFDCEDGSKDYIDDSEAVDQKYGINSLEFYRSKRVDKDHRRLLEEELEVLGYEHDIHETRFVPNSIFYLSKQPINLQAAHSFGLGVVQILQGKYKGEFMLYNSEKYDAPDLFEADKHDEQMRLRMYFQYTNPLAHFDEYVYRLIKNDWELASILIVNHRQYMLDFFQTVAAYHREKEKGKIHIDLARKIRGMKFCNNF